jgi:hypothetical protein
MLSHSPLFSQYLPNVSWVIATLHVLGGVWVESREVGELDAQRTHGPGHSLRKGPEGYREYNTHVESRNQEDTVQTEQESGSVSWVVIVLQERNSIFDYKKETGRRALQSTLERNHWLQKRLSNSSSSCSSGIGRQ